MNSPVQPSRPTARRAGPGVVPGALALLAGLAHTAAFAPVDAWWLQILAMAALVALLWQASPRQAAWRTLMFGLGWLGAGWWWLYISMHRYGGMPAPLAVLAVVVLAAAMSLYTAAAAAAWAHWRQGAAASVAVAVPMWAGLWTLAELARATWFTGFPWSASGYAHTVGPFTAWAPWIGVYGITALSAALAAALGAMAVAAVRPAGPAMTPRLGPALAALLVTAGLGVGGLTLPQGFTTSTGSLGVSLVQPAVAQDLKFDPRRVEGNLRSLQQAVASARGDLVVTPESVVPLPFGDVAPAHWQALQDAVSAPGRGLLVGVFLPARNDPQGRYVNSMIGLSAHSDPATGRFYHYGKRHLLPFGEFVPPGFRWFVDLMHIPLEDQAAGSTERTFDLAGQRLRPLICYEDLFGEDVVGSVVGPRPASVFVNASNLAWFGPDMVQDQHLQFSRMRALEFQRPIVRATNTGATAAVDHTGRVIDRLPAEVAGVLETRVDGRIGATPYAQWLSRAGLWPVWALAALASAWGAGVAFRLRRRGGGR